MAFIREYTSKEDELKFGTSVWIVDREREIFLNWQSFGREDNLIKFTLHSYIDGKLLIKADAQDRSIEFLRQENDKTARWYNVYSTFIPEDLMPKKEELKSLLVEAIDEFGRNMVNTRNDRAKVKITPFRD